MFLWGGFSCGLVVYGQWLGFGWYEFVSWTGQNKQKDRLRPFLRTAFINMSYFQTHTPVQNCAWSHLMMGLFWFYSHLKEFNDIRSFSVQGSRSVHGVFLTCLGQFVDCLTLCSKWTRFWFSSIHGCFESYIWRLVVWMSWLLFSWLKWRLMAVSLWGGRPVVSFKHKYPSYPHI